MTTTTPLVTGTDFITVATRDIDTAEPFYRDVLGLPVGKRWGQMPAVEFETGNLTIAVMQSEAFGMEFRPSASLIALHVDDFDAAKAELESRGVEFKGDVIDSSASRRTSRTPTATPSASTTATRQ